MNILFVTWDGPQVNYLEGLFLPIFQGLMEKGMSFRVLQFTWGATVIERSRRACEQAGVPYHAVRVLRTPRAAGALASALLSARRVRTLVRGHGIDVLMPRSVLPALVCMRAMRGMQKMPMVFDADGLPLDERVDFSGLSPTSIVHRLQRDIEAQAVHRAAVVLARSKMGARILADRAGAGTDASKFHVVMNGRSAGIYHPGDDAHRSVVRAEFGIDADAPLIIYAGSLGEQYCLEEMLTFFHAVRRRRPAARFLVLTGQRAFAESVMRQMDGLEAGVVLASLTPGEVARTLPAADLGLALRRVSYSMQAVAPIKLGEYLLSGMPVFATQGIGDTGCIGNDAGFLWQGDSMQLEAAAEWFVKQVLPAREHFRNRARETGLRHFSLEASVGTYMDALQGVCRAASD